MGGNVKTSKVRDKNDKTMSFHINDKNLLEKNKLFRLRLKI